MPYSCEAVGKAVYHLKWENALKERSTIEKNISIVAKFSQG
jgi:hypothetical protein